jgi:hypothetical protein
MCKQASAHFLNPTKTPPKERPPTALHPAHMAYMYISRLTTMTHKLTLNPCQIYKVALRKEKQVLALKTIITVLIGSIFSTGYRSSELEDVQNKWLL